MKTITLILITALLIVLYSCEDIKKGYLETQDAEYVTDTLFMCLNPSVRDSVPYQSESIQGIIGTFPITYEISSVRDSTGAIVPVEVSKQITVILTGVIEIPKAHTIPLGIYSIDLQVSNIHGKVILYNVYTIVVMDCLVSGLTETSLTHNIYSKICPIGNSIR